MIGDAGRFHVGRCLRLQAGKCCSRTSVQQPSPDQTSFLVNQVTQLVMVERINWLFFLLQQQLPGNQPFNGRHSFIFATPTDGQQQVETDRPADD